VVVNQAGVHQIVLIGLKSFLDWHKHPRVTATVAANPPGLQKVYDAIEKLTHSQNQKLQLEAKNVYLALKKT
jgi:hypothetical protein